jgi:hypothetical protein
LLHHRTVSEIGTNSRDSFITGASNSLGKDV